MKSVVPKNYSNKCVWAAIYLFGAISLSYRLGPKLAWFVLSRLCYQYSPLISLNSPVFLSLFLTPQLFSKPPTVFTLFSFYSLSLVGLSSWFSHFSHIPTSFSIPGDLRYLRGSSWNLFQILNSVWQQFSNSTINSWFPTPTRYVFYHDFSYY